MTEFERLKEECTRYLSERDLYLHLLELGSQRDLAPLLEKALSLIVGVTQAKKGYLALHEQSSGKPRFAISKSYTESETNQLHQQISSGVIAKAIATGDTINIASAQEDPQFRDNQSVIAHNIEAILCAPIGVDIPVGVLYLQDREQAAPSQKKIENAPNSSLGT